METFFSALLVLSFVAIAGMGLLILRKLFAGQQ
jgi:hypothetical protein